MGLVWGDGIICIYISCSCLRIAADSSIHSRFWYFPKKYGMMSEESDNLRYKLPQADVLKDQTVHSFGGQSCWASILLVLAFGEGTVELRYLYCVNNRRVDVGMLTNTILDGGLIFGVPGHPCFEGHNLRIVSNNNTGSSEWFCPPFLAHLLWSLGPSVRLWL